MKNKRKIKIAIAAVVIAIAAAAAFLACFFTIDAPMDYKYAVSVLDADAQILRVNLIISSPLFCKQEAAYVYLGDKDVNILDCTDGRGRTQETFLSDGIIAAPVSRGGKAVIIYDVPMGMPVKHGNRGAINDDYIIFDGDQVFLLPARFYFYDDKAVRETVGSVRFTFDIPEGWTSIIPFDSIKKPGWSDIYAMHKNAFVFGRFDSVIKTGTGMNVYVPTGAKRPETGGFEALFAYYADVFGSAPAEYSIVLLPPDETEDRIIAGSGDGPVSGRIIGGAGTAVTASSFGYNNLRDWQLLSHRMFHAFYDTAAPNVNTHIPPNVWFNEGMSTYYENVALEALPDSLKSQLGVDSNMAFAIIFDQYLYMRIKDPYLYTFAAMDEAEIESGALTEYLHYTAAPLIVKLLIDKSVDAGRDSDDLLRYCLSENESPITAFWAALEMLGDNSQDFCETYMLSAGIPPLWYLKQYQPPSRDVLIALNNIEIILESWWKLEDDSYRAYLVTEEQLIDALDAANDECVMFLPPDLTVLFEEYCPEVYALLNDYYRQALENGIAIDDANIRAKLLRSNQ